MAQSIDMARAGSGTNNVLVVSGSTNDRNFWEAHFGRTHRDIFRSSGDTSITSVVEPHPKGNFLGTVRAWSLALADQRNTGEASPHVGLMSMVIGQGKRLSPFTQALCNRKAAFPVPFIGNLSGEFLRNADLSNLHTNLWVRHLDHSGFKGLVIKWSDEAIIPGRPWMPTDCNFADIDAVRFVWQIEPTEELAREKDWVAFDPETGLMTGQFSRQELSGLHARIAAAGSEHLRVGVNLGSLAVSYDLLNAAIVEFQSDLDTPNRAPDWDPYVWTALVCRDESAWRREAEWEDRLGRRGIRDLERAHPDFYRRISQWRARFEAQKRRPIRIAVLDFGPAFWVDMGLHPAVYDNLAALLSRTDYGAAMRQLFGISAEPDENGNLIIESSIHESARVRDSFVFHSSLQGPSTVVENGIIVGSTHTETYMPYGGASLFNAVKSIRFDGPRAVAFRSFVDTLSLPAGGRHATLLASSEPIHMLTNESVTAYEGETFEKPIFGNPISFADAAELMAHVDGRTLEARWRAILSAQG